MEGVDDDEGAQEEVEEPVEDGIALDLPRRDEEIRQEDHGPARPADDIDDRVLRHEPAILSEEGRSGKLGGLRSAPPGNSSLYPTFC